MYKRYPMRKFKSEFQDCENAANLKAFTAIV